MYISLSHLPETNQNAYPECTPVLPLPNHLTHFIHHVQNAQTRLQRPNPLVQIRRSPLTLQQRLFLRRQPLSNLGDRLVQAVDLIAKIYGVRSNGQKS